MSRKIIKHLSFNKPLLELDPVLALWPKGAWNFFSRWVLGNMIGAGLGIVAGLVVASELLMIPLRVVLWGIVGAIVGITQQAVLQQRFNLKNWVWASIAGWLMGGFLAGGEGINWGVIGSTVGAMQWLVLRQHIQRAGWWVAANPTGLIFGSSFGWSIRFTSRWSFFRHLASIDERIFEIADWIMAGIVGGAVTGIITGLWLMWLIYSESAQIK